MRCRFKWQKKADPIYSVKTASSKIDACLKNLILTPLYSLDQFDPVKQKKSRKLLETLAEDFQGVISTQVLQEFYVTAVNKLGADPLLIKDILYAYERFEIVIITPDRIKEAIDCSIINRLSFWDALIVVAAESANCERLWSEDLNDGQVIRGVRIENPL